MFALTARAIKKTKRKNKAQTKYGGTGFASTQLYQLLEVADIVHDFIEDEDMVMETIKTGKYDLPNNMAPTLLLDATGFMNFMKTTKTLQFKTGAVANPLYKLDLVSPLELDAYSTLDDMFEAAQRSIQGKLGNQDAKSCPIDVYVDCSVNASIANSSRVLKVHQIVQLCTAIRKWFGQELIFQLDSANDSGNPLVLLMTGVKNVHRSLLHNLVFDPIETVYQVNEKIRMAMLATVDTVALSWDAFTTDANVFDAADNKNRPPDDVRPTGPVFPEWTGLAYQIELRGLVPVNGETQTGVSVKITDVDKTVHDLVLHEIFG